jgi:hypothetical protein
MYPEGIRTTPTGDLLKLYMRRERNHPPRIAGGSEEIPGPIGGPKDIAPPGYSREIYQIQ